MWEGGGRMLELGNEEGCLLKLSADSGPRGSRVISECLSVGQYP